MSKPKLVVIIGPTASGKSSLAVRIAKKFNGEVISADSRQVYKGLDIGTGKITKKEMRGVPHHLLDVENPKKVFTASKYKTLAEEAIRKISAKGKLPIICGGTGFYIDVLLGEKQIPEVEPNLKLRKQLETKTAPRLFEMLKKLDPGRAKIIDANNPRRLIRAIEIAKAIGKVPPLRQSSAGQAPYDVFKIGIVADDKDLKDKISKRLKSRMGEGMVKEARNLHKNGLTYKKMRSFGLEYKYLADLLEKKISKMEFSSRLETEIWQYAKRQMTWFKKDKNIIWIKGDTEKAGELISVFLK